jgi:hypothetical protein
MSRIEPPAPGADNHRQQSPKAWLLVSQPLEGSWGYIRVSMHVLAPLRVKFRTVGGIALVMAALAVVLPLVLSPAGPTQFANCSSVDGVGNAVDPQG